MIAAIHGPHLDWSALAPLVALYGGGTIVLLAGLLGGRFVRVALVPGLTLATLLASLGLTIWQWHANTTTIAGALRVDDLALALNGIFVISAAASVLLSWRAAAPRLASPGEYFALLLFSAAGMLTLVEAQNLVTLFLGLEMLSIPLYVLCASESRRATSLEAGLKYLVVGSVGSATLLYGLALVYGATGATDFGAIATALHGGILTDPLFLTGLALIVTGLGFKSSVAPFHQWTPDVYDGAPTPITAFMATATKAAALGVFLRLFDVAFINAQVNWAPAVAALAAVTIVVGNVGALGQTSVKRLLAWSSVAQAGYMLAGVVVSTQLGIRATVWYLAAYLVMNLAAFAVVVARERETSLGDGYGAYEGLGASRPVLAWPLTIALLSLAGFPATSGFVGKFFLIDAAVDGDYTWLGVVIVIGSIISLAYYLRLVGLMWGRSAPAAEPVLAGGSADAEAELADGVGSAARPAGWEVVTVAVVCGAATIALGIIPSPLFDLTKDAGRAIGGLF